MKKQAVIAGCQAALGHRFADTALLLQALTHRSYANEQRQQKPNDNERLEFLGDAVLSLMISDLLWQTFPDAPEGELTRRRADLVSERGLADVASQIGLGEYLLLGKGEARSGGSEKPRLLASGLEACFGAIYLDGGLEAVMATGKVLFADRLAAERPGATDYKSRAQEFFQAQGKGAPSYQLRSTQGPDHAKMFHVAIVAGDRVLAEGHGRSKTEAEQNAARAALAAATGKPTDS